MSRLQPHVFTYTVTAMIAFTGEPKRPWTEKIRAESVEQAKDEYIRRVHKVFGAHKMISDMKVYDSLNYDVTDGIK